MNIRLDDPALAQLFASARSYRVWQQQAVPDALLTELYALTKMGPTSGNCCPARLVFVKTAEAKARLKPLLAAGNVDKTMSAPVTCIVGYDMEFYEQLPVLAPHADGRAGFVGKPDLIESTAFRNGSLQGAYVILAARALGLDCGPMSGFDNKKVDAEFFAGTSVKSNFLINLGIGDPAKLHPRQPRLEFGEACSIV